MLGGAWARRAKILLLAADGVSNSEIARRFGASHWTILEWRRLFSTHGVKAVHQVRVKSPGRPPVHSRAKLRDDYQAAVRRHLAIPFPDEIHAWAAAIIGATAQSVAETTGLNVRTVSRIRRMKGWEWFGWLHGAYRAPVDPRWRYPWRVVRYADVHEAWPPGVEWVAYGPDPAQ